MIECGPAPSVESTSVSQEGVMYQSVAHYTCLLGYTYTGGSNTSTCQEDGMWSEVDVHCAGMLGVFYCFKSADSSLLPLIMNENPFGYNTVTTTCQKKSEKQLHIYVYSGPNIRIKHHLYDLYI